MPSRSGEKILIEIPAGVMLSKTVVPMESEPHWTTDISLFSISPLAFQKSLTDHDVLTIALLESAQSHKEVDNFYLPLSNNRSKELLALLAQLEGIMTQDELIKLEPGQKISKDYPREKIPKAIHAGLHSEIVNGIEMILSQGVIVGPSNALPY